MRSPTSQVSLVVPTAEALERERERERCCEVKVEEVVQKYRGQFSPRQRRVTSASRRDRRSALLVAATSVCSAVLGCDGERQRERGRGGEGPSVDPFSLNVDSDDEGLGLDVGHS
jgi:hypothetical protein